MLNNVGWYIVGTHSVYHSWCSFIPSVMKRFPCASCPFHDPLVTEELQLFCQITMVVINWFLFYNIHKNSMVEVPILLNAFGELVFSFLLQYPYFMCLIWWIPLRLKLRKWHHKCFSRKNSLIRYGIVWFMCFSHRVIHPVLKVYLKSSKLVPLGWNFMKIGGLRQLPLQTALMLLMNMIYRFVLLSLRENCKVVLGCISEICTQVNFQRTVTALATTWFNLQIKSFSWWIHW